SLHSWRGLEHGDCSAAVEPVVHQRRHGDEARSDLGQERGQRGPLRAGYSRVVKVECGLVRVGNKRYVPIVALSAVVPHDLVPDSEDTRLRLTRHELPRFLPGVVLQGQQAPASGAGIEQLAAGYYPPGSAQVIANVVMLAAVGGRNDEGQPAHVTSRSGGRLGSRSLAGRRG